MQESCVKKYVCERLPDSEQEDGREGHQPKPVEPKPLASLAEN